MKRRNEENNNKNNNNSKLSKIVNIINKIQAHHLQTIKMTSDKILEFEENWEKEKNWWKPQHQSWNRKSWSNGCGADFVYQYIGD